MVHLVAAPPNDNSGLLFNVDGVVGAPPALNKREDVLFVQFAIHVDRRSYTGGIVDEDQGVVSASRDLQVTGFIDDVTIDSIREYQLRQKRYTPGTMVDGRVSPARGDNFSYGGRLGSPLTLITLNDALGSAIRVDWPRIDRIPGCPDELKETVIRLLGLGWWM